jgi:hypothetical protein
MDQGSNFRDGYDFRRFDARVEQQAARWRGMDVDTDFWKPYDKLSTEKDEWVTDGRNVCYIKTATGKIYKEKIVADIGYDLGFPVAPGCLWQPPGMTLSCANETFLSLAPFSLNKKNTYCDYLDIINPIKTNDEEIRKALLRKRGFIENRLLLEASAANTALWLFNLWIGDQAEHQFSQNIQLSIADMRNRGVRIASHDHAEANLRFFRPHSCNSELLGLFSGQHTRVPDEDGSTKWHAPIDRKALFVAINRINAYPQAQLHSVVDRIPGTFLKAGKKKEIARALCKSRLQLTEWVRDQFGSSDEEAPKPATSWGINQIATWARRRALPLISPS